MKRVFKWIFKDELCVLQKQINKSAEVVSDCNELAKQFRAVLSNIDVSVDVHEYKYAPSWAVISLQGNKTDYIKFIDLGEADLREIGSFLRRYERRSNIKIDASPRASHFLKVF